VNNHDEQGKDFRSQPRWSAGKKTEAVLRGEFLEELSRELKVEAHRLAAWRDDFLAAGSQALKGQRPDRSGREHAAERRGQPQATDGDRRREQPSGALVTRGLVGSRCLDLGRGHAMGFG
jgi:hypothetical protein